MSHSTDEIAQGLSALGHHSESVNDTKNIAQKTSESSVLNAVLSYAAQGIPVFPCRQDKSPWTIHGFKDASTDEAQLRSWWTLHPDALIGLSTGTASGIIALDIDVKKGARGEQSLKDLISTHGQLPSTRVVQTPSGGWHYYFSAVPGVRNSQGKIGPGIDVRADGGYIIAPPSAGYVFIAGTENIPLAPAPVWLVKMATDHPEPKPLSVSGGITTTGNTHVGDVRARARAYLEKMPAAVSGSGGHNAAYAAAVAMVHGFELPEAEALAVLISEYNPRCSPPWSDDELRHKVEDAGNKPHSNPKGWLLHAPRAPSGSPRSFSMDTGIHWPNLEPLGAIAAPMPFDICDMLPQDVPELAELVLATAEALQVPMELAASVVLGLTALACSRSVEVECSENWREPAALWFLILLRPGERKSASMSALTGPFREWMEAERKKLNQPLAKYAERRRGVESRLAWLRSAAAKQTKADTRAHLNAEAVNLAAELAAMPSGMATPDLLAQSFTPEGLRDALEANGEKLGIVSAEADASDLLGSRYSDAPNIDLLLCAHAGDPITTRRAGNRSIPLQRPAVSLVLAIQPTAISSVLSDKMAKGRGLIDRMLLIHPISRMGSRLLDPEPVPFRLSQWWSQRVHAALNLPWFGRVIIGQSDDPVRCTSSARVLHLHPEAREHLWALRSDLEPRLSEGADLAGVSGFASKLAGACARIALAFTILRDSEAEEIGAEAMQAACAWAPFLLAHHRRVVGEAVESPEVKHGRRLLRAIQRRGHTPMTGRDLFKLVHDSALPDMKAFSSVLALLVDHGSIHLLPSEPGGRGRPTDRYAIHPDLLPSSGKMSDILDTMDEPNGLLSDMSDNSEGEAV